MNHVLVLAVFQVHIKPLLPTERYYLPQETGNYSVAGFRMVMERKISHYVITYYLPSGLFVVVSWASFLIPADDIQVRPFLSPFILVRMDCIVPLSHLIPNIIGTICWLMSLLLDQQGNIWWRKEPDTVIDYLVEDVLSVMSLGFQSMEKRENCWVVYILNWGPDILPKSWYWQLHNEDRRRHLKIIFLILLMADSLEHF